MSYRWKTKIDISAYAVWIIFLSCMFFPLHSISSEYPTESEEVSHLATNDKLSLTSLGEVKVDGWVGAEIDKVIHARILSDYAVQEILPEALEAFEKRVDDLIATQREDGYIGTYNDSEFLVGNNWNVWCRKYTLWGLLEGYELLKDPSILSAAVRFMDHLMTEVGPGKVDMVKTGNFVGLPSSSILTPLISLYRHTDDNRYLEYARYIVQNWSKYPGDPPDLVNKGLTATPVHTWFPEAGRWTKAYEFISCVEGLIELYRIEGKEQYLQAAKNIYEVIRQNERVITGGIGYHDKLDHAAIRTDGLNEPCDVVYWERLSVQLLRLTGEPRYADEIERLAYNVLMAAMNEDGSWGVRRLGISEPHLISPLHCFLDNHQCCVANVPRVLLQIPEVAVMQGNRDDSIVMNLYFQGTAAVELASGQMVHLEMNTDYPESGGISIALSLDEPVSFPLKLRIPFWSKKTMVEVNGEPVENITPGTYLTLSGRWRTENNIRMDFEMTPRIVNIPGNSSHVAFMCGPVVLARSELLGDIHRDEPVQIAAAGSQVPELKRVDAPEELWMKFEMQTLDKKTLVLCDYVSTGKRFQKPDDPYAVKQMLDNRTMHDLRVWMPVDSSAVNE